jgi:hypothetical protein
MDTTDAKKVAWIFLAISFWDKSQVTRAEISHSADAINHAVPPENELDLAIRFLTRQGFIEKQGKFFTITDAGRAILEPAHEGAANIFGVWTALEARIASLSVA